MDNSPIIVALDFPEPAKALALAARLNPGMCRLKVGKELFTAGGPQIIESLHRKGFEIFLDLKFHDIPNTVAGAVKAAAALGVWMVNVHASGGRRMMEAAREALEHCTSKRPWLIAVTMLTSLDQEDLREVGIEMSAHQMVHVLASLSNQCGLDGVVCGSHETIMLRNVLGEKPLLVTPGIRLDDSPQDDQKRVSSPQEAIKKGASYLVIGRPITQASDPVLVLEKISAQLEKNQ